MDNLIKDNTGFHEKDTYFGHDGFPYIIIPPLLLIRER